MRLPGRITRRARQVLSYVGVGVLVAAAAIAQALQSGPGTSSDSPSAVPPINSPSARPSG